MSKLLVSFLTIRSGLVATRTRHLPLAGCVLNDQSISRRWKGHSKWQNIRHVKAANDAIKSVTASKYSFLIKGACKESGGADLKLNRRLQEVFNEGLKAGVSKATLERAINRAANAKMIHDLAGILTPGGAFLLCDFETDQISDFKFNLKQAVKKVKGSAIMKTGQAERVFSQRGFVRMAKKDKNGAEVSFEKAEEIGIEADAEEVREDEEDPNLWVLESEAGEIYKVKAAIEKSFPDVSVEDYFVGYVPMSTIQLSDDDLAKASALCDAINEIEDVNKIYTNIG